MLAPELLWKFTLANLPNPTYQRGGVRLKILFESVGEKSAEEVEWKYLIGITEIYANSKSTIWDTRKRESTIHV